MKTKALGAAILWILLLSLPALAAEGHQADAGGIAFIINQTEVSLSLQPVHYIKETKPEISALLKNIHSRSAILDAELYLLLEPENPHAIMTEDVEDSSHTAAVPAAEEMEMALDFGFEQMPAIDVDLSDYIQLEPRQMSGMYSATYPLSTPGTYNFTLAFKSIEGKIYSDPLTYGGKITYQPESKAPLHRMIFGMAVLFISGLIAVMFIAFKTSLKLRAGESLNLLDIRWIKKFFRSQWYQPVFQIPTFIVFLIIIFVGLTDIQEGNKNVATMLTWTIWWAGVIFTFVLMGRVWCMMCPFGAAQDWLGRRVSLNKNFPLALRNIWLSTFLFLGLTWWDSYSGIVNNPALTAYLFIGFFAVSIATALIYKGRTFCRYICPLGGLIGLYSMFSPVELRNRCLDVCRSDTIKGCIHGTPKSFSCPMFETPMTLERNNYCNFCSECVKSCAQDNIVLRFRSFARDLWVSAKGYMDEAYLAMVLVGLTIIATAEMVEPWHKWLDGVINALPLAAIGVTSHVVQENFAFTLILIVGALILPSLLLLGTSTLVKSFAGQDNSLSTKKIFIQFSYMFIPVGLSMHLAHNVSHLLREGGQLVPAIQRALNKYTWMHAGEVNWDVAPLIGLETLFWFQLATLAVLNVFSLYAGYRISMKNFEGKAMRAFIPMAVLAVAFMLVNAFVLGQPMALRHTH